LNSVAILTDVKQDYSVGLAKAFQDSFTASGGTVVKSVDYSTGDKDFRAQLTDIKAAHPDAIFVPGYYGEVALIAREARQLGIKAPLLGGDGWVGESLLKVAGHALDGSFFSNHYSQDDPSPVIQNFVKTYQAKYGEKPDAMAALGYDSAKILATARRHRFDKGFQGGHRRHHARRGPECHEGRRDPHDCEWGLPIRPARGALNPNRTRRL
jgi:branched-chain amino acid transport system substrate-binding protein